MTTITKQQARNVEHLAKFLETHVANHQFLMDHFTSGESRCEAVGCALGFAPYVRALREQGLKNVAHGSGFTLAFPGFAPGHAEVQIAKAVFGAEWNDLFHGSLAHTHSIHTPKQWARHARRWLATQTVV